MLNKGKLQMYFFVTLKRHIGGIRKSKKKKKLYYTVLKIHQYKIFKQSAC